MANIVEHGAKDVSGRKYTPHTHSNAHEHRFNLYSTDDKKKDKSTENRRRTD